MYSTYKKRKSFKTKIDSPRDIRDYRKRERGSCRESELLCATSSSSSSRATAVGEFVSPVAAAVASVVIISYALCTRRTGFFFFFFSLWSLPTRFYMFSYGYLLLMPCLSLSVVKRKQTFFFLLARKKIHSILELNLPSYLYYRAPSYLRCLMAFQKSN